MGSVSVVGVEVEWGRMGWWNRDGGDGVVSTLGREMVECGREMGMRL